MMMTMNNFTQQTIDALKKCPQCLESLRQVKCYDYEARFGAFIRVKCGIILLSMVDWHIVAQELESLL
jgi:hypothetical protein